MLSHFYINPSYSKSLGYSMQDLIEMFQPDIFPSQSHYFIETKIEELLEVLIFISEQTRTYRAVL
jgi:hypothetical protein